MWYVITNCGALSCPDCPVSRGPQPQLLVSSQRHFQFQPLPDGTQAPRPKCFRARPTRSTKRWSGSSLNRACPPRSTAATSWRFLDLLKRRGRSRSYAEFFGNHIFMPGSQAPLWGLSSPWGPISATGPKLDAWACCPKRRPVRCLDPAFDDKGRRSGTQPNGGGNSCILRVSCQWRGCACVEGATHPGAVKNLLIPSQLLARH
jgi:hypothetical protein